MKTLTRQQERQAVDAAQSLGPVMARMAEVSRRDPAVFCQFVLRDETTGQPIRLAPMHEEWHDILNNSPRVVLWTSTESGKAVPLSTQIPTPTGWRTMGDLEIGDLVLGRDGKPCRVVGASPVQHGRTVYRVRFDDGGEAMADADHRWLARRQSRRVEAREISTSGCACGCGRTPAPGKRFIHNHHGRVRQVSADGYRVVTTKEMLDRGVTTDGGPRSGGGRYRRFQWLIPLCGPAEFSEAILPIDPYTLGAWLGDGDSSGPVLTFHRDDAFVHQRCAAAVGSHPWRFTPRAPNVVRASLGPSTNVRSNDGLVAKLRRCGVLNNKHIPDVYMTSSVEQRQALLEGLMDTDGTIDPGGAAEFSNCNERLARQVLEVVRSLGHKAKIKSRRMKIYGRDLGEAWRVTFTPRRPVFSLPRKLARQASVDRPIGKADTRSIVAIEEVATVPVKCIAVSSPDHAYLMGRDFTVTHNTSGLSVGRVLWEIGKNPAIRILVLSSSSGAAKKIVKSIKNYIENSAEYRSVFPDVTPDKSNTTGMWRDDAFIIRRSTMPKDPTIQASGYGGNILGSRYDLILIDDYLTAENTYSQHNRDKYYSWLKSTVESRRTQRGRLWFVGNAWHMDDAMHRYSAEPGTYSKKYPVVDGAGNLSWPEVWPQSRITEEIANRGPIESRRSLFCDPVADADRKFKLEYIQAALTNGDGMELIYALQAVPTGMSTVTGVDLAVTKKTSGDETALVTIAVEHKRQVRQILDITAGRFSGPETVDLIIDINRRYNSMVIVESNAAQSYIRQFTREKSAVPVRAFFTGKNKYDPAFGVESLAVEFSAGKWIVPNHGGTTAGFNARMAPEVKKLINEMLNYDPQSHTGDRVMATWLAREGARLSAAPPGQGKRPRRT